MKVDVLLFASLKDELGPSFTVDLGAVDEVTVGALRQALERAHPAFSRLGRRALVAVNEVWAADGDPVRDGSSVAFVPPVAGG
jgi:MoaE-MoaD fusion protein